jgi:hypothetical protein
MPDCHHGARLRDVRLPSYTDPTCPHLPLTALEEMPLSEKGDFPEELRTQLSPDVSPLPATWRQPTNPEPPQMYSGGRWAQPQQERHNTSGWLGEL